MPILVGHLRPPSFPSSYLIGGGTKQSGGNLGGKKGIEASQLQSLIPAICRRTRATSRFRFAPINGHPQTGPVGPCQRKSLRSPGGAIDFTQPARSGLLQRASVRVFWINRSAARSSALNWAYCSRTNSGSIFFFANVDERCQTAP